MAPLPKDVIPDSWQRLIEASEALAAAEDATDAVRLDLVEPGTPYNRLLSLHQGWKNKYARCEQRGLILTPFKIRRRPLKTGGYEIEAVRDTRAPTVGATVLWPDD